MRTGRLAWPMPASAAVFQPRAVGSKDLELRSAGVMLGATYPQPIIDHATARRPRARRLFQLQQNPWLTGLDRAPWTLNRNQLVTAMVSYSSTAHWGISMGKCERIKDKAQSASPNG